MDFLFTSFQYLVVTLALYKIRPQSAWPSFPLQAILLGVIWLVCGSSLGIEIVVCGAHLFELEARQTTIVYRRLLHPTQLVQIKKIAPKTAVSAGWMDWAANPFRRYQGVFLRSG
jgi:hypothetical protein